MQATRNSRKRRKARAGGPTPTDQLIDAARRWHVPLWALVGVKLQESGTSTSDNPFQFEPSTASSQGVDVNDFGSSANGAARLLASYRKQFGSWNAAFEAYNGGPGAVGAGYAYNEADIKAKLAEFGLGSLAGQSGRVTASFLGGYADALKKELEGLFIPHSPKIPKTPFGEVEIPGLGDPLGGLRESIPNLTNIDRFFSLLTSGETWIRLGEILAGALLIYLALKAFTGQGVSDLPGYAVARATVPV